MKSAILFFCIIAAGLFGYLIGQSSPTTVHTVEIVTDSVYIRDLEQENERLTREIDSLMYGDIKNTCNL
jgi:hypothetical protein